MDSKCHINLSQLTASFFAQRPYSTQFPVLHILLLTNHTAVAKAYAFQP